MDDGEDAQGHNQSAIDGCLGTCHLGVVVHGYPPNQQDHDFLHPDDGAVSGVRVWPCQEQGCTYLRRAAAGPQSDGDKRRCKYYCSNNAIIQAQSLRQFQEQVDFINMIYSITIPVGARAVQGRLPREPGATPVHNI